MSEPIEQTVVPLRPGRPTRPAPARTAAPEPLLRHVVGAILRRARLQQRRTLQDVATAAQVSTAYLSEVERGRKEPSSEVLAAVCRALGIRLVDLVARTQDELAAAAQVRVLRSTVSSAARTSGRHEVRTSTPSPLQRSDLQGMLLAA